MRAINMGTILSIRSRRGIYRKICTQVHTWVCNVGRQQLASHTIHTRYVNEKQAFMWRKGFEKQQQYFRTTYQHTLLVLEN
jgi:hypothetical protein